MTQNEANIINKAIRKNNGEFLSKYFKIEYIKANTDAFCSFSEDKIGNLIDGDFWPETLSAIFQMYESPDGKKGFKLYSAAVMALIRSFRDFNTRVMTPIMKSVANTLSFFAESGEYNDAGNLLQKILSLYHRRDIVGESPVLCIANKLVCVYSMKNNFKQASNVIKIVEDGGISLDDFEPGEITEFHFNRGKIHSVNCNIYEAKEDLLFALNHTPLTQINNRRLICAYLVPVQLCCGIIPSVELIEKYSLKLYQGFVDAVVKADPNLYEETLRRNQLELMKLGQLDLVIRIKQIIYIRLLKMIHDTIGDSRMDTSLFTTVMNEFCPTSNLEAEMIISTLIKEGYVKAYMVHKLGKIVFSKQDPFPNIEEHK